MEEEKKDIENNTLALPEVVKDPSPLALEGSSAQLELDIKPKPQDKKTTVHFQDKNLIKNIIGTPKERPGGESEVNPNAGKQSSAPKEEIKAIQERLSNEEKQYEGETPTASDCEDTAEMFVFIIDMIMTFIASKFAIDKDEKEYQIDATKKAKLKKYLALYLAKMNKKYPIGFMLLLTAIGCYLPVFSKAYSHRKIVLEERAKKKATVIATEPDGGKKRRRRRLDDDSSGSGNAGSNGKGGHDDAEYYPAEEVK